MDLCCVCKTDNEADTLPPGASCQHMFCSTCVDIFATRSLDKCPLCRAEMVTPDGLRPLGNESVPPPQTTGDFLHEQLGVQLTEMIVYQILYRNRMAGSQGALGDVGMTGAQGVQGVYNEVFAPQTNIPLIAVQTNSRSPKLKRRYKRLISPTTVPSITGLPFW
jgi:hypothetical protein